MYISFYVSTLVLPYLFRGVEKLFEKFLRGNVSWLVHVSTIYFFKPHQFRMFCIIHTQQKLSRNFLNF